MTSAAPTHFTLVELQRDKNDFAADVRAGLMAIPKRLACRYFYDALGSALFAAICHLPEYYLTRAEAEIVGTHADEFADLFPGGIDIIELGSGNAAKTRLLLEAFLRRYGTQRYAHIDICRSVLEDTSRELIRNYPNLTVLAIGGEYRESLEYILSIGRSQGNAPAGRKLILWLGSNIGNFSRTEAAGFLAQLRQTMSPGDAFLIGIDLRKDQAVLQAAYDDPCGLTAAFNRNLLLRINRELGGQFDLRTFAHHAAYQSEQGVVAMYLISDRKQTVRIESLALEVPFERDETIHTENSYKYSLAEIDELARAAGIRRQRTWLDEQSRFSVNLFCVPPANPTR